MQKKISLQKVTVFLPEDKQTRKDCTYLFASDEVKLDPLTGLYLSDRSAETLSTQLALEECESWQGSGQEDGPSAQSKSTVRKLRNLITNLGSQAPALHKLVKDSGIYALSSITAPLIALVLAPFLSYTLSPSSYGILTLLNTAISLVAGITQLGLGSAFFRAYGYDYTEKRDKRDIVATTTALLLTISLLITILAIITAPFLAILLLGNTSFSELIIIAAGAIFLQNLTVPGFAWLRAESRPLFYSLLSISNVLITLLANIALVGALHWGIAGSLVATGGGYLSTVICTIPFLIYRAGLRMRKDIARNLLGFGVPLVLNFVAYWILQLSDRYLLSRSSSFAETGRYSIAYNLGSALIIIVISPFTLAWPTTMFAIAKRENAKQVFRLLFHWFSLFLLFAAFGLSLIATLLLDWFFPPTYHSVALIIPTIAVSGVFYGAYYVFTVGINIKRKTWMISIFTTIAAIINFLANLMLIPRYGAMGAALSTLIAYIALALVAYLVNQKVYPIRFPIGRFIIALLLGAALYVESSIWAEPQSYIKYGIYAVALILYGGLLVALGKLPAWRTVSSNLKYFL